MCACVCMWMCTHTCVCECAYEWMCLTVMMQIGCTAKERSKTTYWNINKQNDSNTFYVLCNNVCACVCARECIEVYACFCDWKYNWIFECYK